MELEVAALLWLGCGPGSAAVVVMSWLSVTGGRFGAGGMVCMVGSLWLERAVGRVRRPIGWRWAG